MNQSNCGVWRLSSQEQRCNRLRRKCAFGTLHSGGPQGGLHAGRLYIIMRTEQIRKHRNSWFTEINFAVNVLSMIERSRGMPPPRAHT